MTFTFQDEAFKKQWSYVEQIANRMANSSNEFDSSDIVLASQINTASQIFNVNLDLFKYDQLVDYSRRFPRFDFVAEISDLRRKEDLNSD